MTRPTPGVVVSGAILSQEGEFTLEDILREVQDKIQDLFDSLDMLKDYIVHKLNSMCDYGLIGRTDAYYFSI